MVRSAMACSRPTASEAATAPVSSNRCPKRFWGRRYCSTGTFRRMGDTAVTSPCSASKTGNSPVCWASRASRMVSFGAAPQPSGHGTRTWR